METRLDLDDFESAEGFRDYVLDEVESNAEFEVYDVKVEQYDEHVFVELHSDESMLTTKLPKIIEKNPTITNGPISESSFDWENIEDDVPEEYRS